uniref:Helicase C-terminal domain-containing protein n=1 Tax=Globodera pallida TaxID=36090 RepID=A0A183CEG5_GLOPA
MIQVSANRVIIFDVSWNPVHDAQAVCRIYRYGQRRRTYIYRLIMSNCMEKQVFNRQLSKHGLQKRVVDEQLIEANVTTKEVENLMDYDESLDVVSAAHRLEREMGEATEELDDDLLKMLIQTFPHNFFELPFLHESMMVEQEQDLSAEEKLEAQLLYEREKRGFNFPPQSYSANAIQSLNPFATAFQRPWHSTPLPKHIELVSALEQQRKQQQTLASPVIIREQLTLPRVIPLIGEPTQHTLKAGDQITMFCSQKGVYFRTLDGIILDATKTQYGRIMIQRLREAPALVQRAIGPAEVIQIDD